MFLFIFSKIHDLMANTSDRNIAVYCPRLKLIIFFIPQPYTPASVPVLNLDLYVYQIGPFSCKAETNFPIHISLERLW